MPSRAVSVCPTSLHLDSPAAIASPVGIINVGVPSRTDRGFASMPLQVAPVGHSSIHQDSLCGNPTSCGDGQCMGTIDKHDPLVATCKQNYHGCQCISDTKTPGYCHTIGIFSYCDCNPTFAPGATLGICTTGSHYGCSCQVVGSGSSSSGGGDGLPNGGQGFNNPPPTIPWSCRK